MTTVQGRPTTDGGVWGSYVEYVKTLEAEVAQLKADVAGQATTVQGPAGLDLDAIRARAEAATGPAPWTSGDDGLIWAERLGDPVGGMNELVDAEFIAHAREDIPTLIAEVEAFRARLDEVEARGWAKAVEAVRGDGFKVAAGAIHNRECADGPSCLATPTSMTRYAGLAQVAVDAIAERLEQIPKEGN